MSLPIRFAILSNARSGTSLLVSSLRLHPQIYCHGEAFHRNIDTHILREFRERHDVCQRDKDPRGFTDQLLAFSAGKDCVGFKLWREQNPVACDYLLQNSEVRKIVLERQNKLAQYSSAQLARRSGIWNIRHDVQRPKRLSGLRVDFDRKRFLHFVRIQTEMFAHYRSHAVGPMLDISYQSLIDLNFSSVLSFLSVRQVRLPTTKCRIHSADILSRFSQDQHGAIIKTLNELNKSEWLWETA